ncbi:hypothetical protein ACFQU2_24290 [Siccirubricoccus deserti]
MLTRRGLIGLSLIALSTARPAAAQVPVVEGFHATLLELMRNARTLGARGREARLRPVMEAAFNLPAMARSPSARPGPA